MLEVDQMLKGHTVFNNALIERKSEKEKTQKMYKREMMNDRKKLMHQVKKNMWHWRSIVKGEG